MVTARSWTTWGNRSTTEEEVVGNIRYVPLIFKCQVCSYLQISGMFLLSSNVIDRLKTLETKVHPRDVYLAKLWTICFRAWMRQSPQLQSQYLGSWKISKLFTFQEFSLIINIDIDFQSQDDPVVCFRSVKECRSRVSALEARVASIDDDVGNQVTIIDKTNGKWYKSDGKTKGNWYKSDGNDIH